ncbi:MAG TPA: hypothetical protein VFD09_11620 [Thiopseudomonas sp.]|nr:hypothetical protein [Thiopseudomonas sp.]
MSEPVKKFTRWAVVYKHDGSPVDGGSFVHKAQADKVAAGKPRSMVVIKMVMMREVGA